MIERFSIFSWIHLSFVTKIPGTAKVIINDLALKLWMTSKNNSSNLKSFHVDLKFHDNETVNLIRIRRGSFKSLRKVGAASKLWCSKKSQIEFRKQGHQIDYQFWITYQLRVDKYKRWKNNVLENSRMGPKMNVLAIMTRQFFINPNCWS